VCKAAGLLIGWDDKSKRALVTNATCDSWKCADCARRMSEDWTYRAVFGARALQAKGDYLDFVTITSHEKLKTFEATERVWRHSWAMLYNALKRRKKDLAYILIPEAHKSGRMHVHAIWNADVTERWLKDNARSRGLGYKCEASRIVDPRRAAFYVAKYLSKSLDHNHAPHFRRIRASRNFPDIPEPDNSLVELRWQYVGTNGALQIVYEECKREGVSLIDLKTGELFDDVDLGTIVSYA